jgi:hypothetical protein
VLKNGFYPAFSLLRRAAGNFPGVIRLNARRYRHSAYSPSGAQAFSGKPKRAAIGRKSSLREGSIKMTRLTRKGSVTLARMFALGAPLLLLGACAAPPPCDACAVAARAEATANQALSTAQQALAAVSASRSSTSEMYQRSLRK